MSDDTMFTTWILSAAALAIAAITLQSQGARENPPSTNPLTRPWTGPYGGVPPWDLAKPELFPAAFEASIAEQRAEIDAIAADPNPATFDNTIAAMERSGQMLDRVNRLFGVIRQNISTPQIQALDREWQPKLSAADDAIVFNPGLFKRIEAVYRSLPASTLAPDQKRLAERTHDFFVRRGARLDDTGKKRLADINQQLATLFSEFRSKVLDAENTWTVLDREADLAGLPDSLISAAKAAATERSLAGKWAIVNTRSSVDPFLTFSTRRDLREKVWKKFKSRGDNGDQHDTKATIASIVKLRAERAKLLDFPSHAHWRMSDTMALQPKAAQALMMRVWPAAVARVQEEVAA